MINRAGLPRGSGPVFLCPKSDSGTVHIRTMPLARHVAADHHWRNYTPLMIWHAFWDEEKGKWDERSICGRAPTEGCADPQDRRPALKKCCEFCLIVLR